MKKIICITAIILSVFACEKMNDKHDKYLANGEIIYIGMIDSLKAFPGNDRIKFRYWIGDPRAKTLNIYWSNRKDSLVVPVVAHAAADSFEVIVDKKNVNIAEGNYTFQWVSFDDKAPRNKSVIFEKNANVYGSRYQSRLTNRIIKKAEAKGNDVVIQWAGSTSTQEVGVEIKYEKRSGETVTEMYKKADMASTTIKDVNFNVSPQYRTLYLPEPTAIDTFRTAYAKISFSAIVNVTQGKPVTAGSLHGAAFLPEYAVDGDFSAVDAKRWISGDTNHWLEIDLQGSYEINSFSFWNGASNTYQLQGLTNFKLQALVDGAWLDVVSVTGNNTGNYSTTFNAVTATKVKFVAESKIRFYEIAVYSIINY